MYVATLLSPDKTMLMQMSLARKVFFWGAIVFLNVATLELGLRVYKAITHGPDPAVPSVIGRRDDQLGWALIPNAVGESTRTGYKIEYRINSKGLRDAETPYDKSPGTYRIVLLGDSRTFGFGVPISAGG